MEGEEIKLHVSMAAVIDTSRIIPVENAKVDLLVNDSLQEQLSYTDNGFYNSSVLVKPETKYTCKVNIPQFNEISVTQVMPAVPTILGIEHINIAGKNEEGTSYPAVKIIFQNSINTDNYYEIEIRTIQRFNDEVYIEKVAWNEIVDPVILNEGLPIPLFSGKMINTDSYQLYLNYTTNSSRSRNGGPTRTKLFPFVVELRQVTEDYYRYKKQLYLYEQGRFADGIITGMTNANLYSNITNGYGIFAGYSSTVSDTITPNIEGYYD